MRKQLLLSTGIICLMLAPVVSYGQSPGGSGEEQKQTRPSEAGKGAASQERAQGANKRRKALRVVRKEERVPGKPRNAPRPRHRASVRQPLAMTSADAATTQNPVTARRIPARAAATRRRRATARTPGTPTRTAPRVAPRWIAIMRPTASPAPSRKNQRMEPRPLRRNARERPRRRKSRAAISAKARRMPPSRARIRARMRTGRPPRPIARAHRRRTMRRPRRAA